MPAASKLKIVSFLRNQNGEVSVVFQLLSESTGKVMGPTVTRSVDDVRRLIAELQNDRTTANVFFPPLPGPGLEHIVASLPAAEQQQSWLRSALVLLSTISDSIHPPHLWAQFTGSSSSPVPTPAADVGPAAAASPPSMLRSVVQLDARVQALAARAPSRKDDPSLAPDSFTKDLLAQISTARVQQTELSALMKRIERHATDRVRQTAAAVKNTPRMAKMVSVVAKHGKPCDPNEMSAGKRVFAPTLECGGMLVSTEDDHGAVWWDQPIPELTTSAFLPGALKGQATLVKLSTLYHDPMEDDTIAQLLHVVGHIDRHMLGTSSNAAAIADERCAELMGSLTFYHTLLQHTVSWMTKLVSLRKGIRACEAIPAKPEEVVALLSQADALWGDAHRAFLMCWNALRHGRQRLHNAIAEEFVDYLNACNPPTPQVARLDQNLDSVMMDMTSMMSRFV